MFLYCNQTSHFIYPKGAFFDAILFTTSKSYSQSNESTGMYLGEALYYIQGDVYIEDI